MNNAGLKTDTPMAPIQSHALLLPLPRLLARCFAPPPALLPLILLPLPFPLIRKPAFVSVTRIKPLYQLLVSLLLLLLHLLPIPHPARLQVHLCDQQKSAKE